MALTGATLFNYFQQKAGYAYTGYLDNTKANRLFAEAIIRVVEKEYAANVSQKIKDDISFLTRTNRAFSITNNQIYTANLQITGLTFVGLVVTLTTRLPHNLISGDSITTTGITGVTNVNGTFTVAGTPSTTTLVFIASVAPVGAYIANTGVIASPKIISDYWHLLAIKAQFDEQLFNINITDATNATPIVLTLDFYNSLRTGEKVKISGVVGNTNANGTVFLKKQNQFKAALYSDLDLQTPIVGNAAYVSGGVIRRFFYNYCKQYVSDQKIGILNIPTQSEPMFETADKLLKIYPLDKTCNEVTIDYIKTPDVVIDVANSVTDLTLYYPDKFLYSVLEEAVLEYSDEKRDTELRQTTTADIVTNP